MKDNQKVMNLLGIGLDSELAEKAVALGFTLTKLRRASKSELAENFNNEEMNSIWEAAKRKPIPEDTLQRLVEECDWKCCVCWDYRKSSPIIIHHIEEHSKSRDDSYDNLVVLCLNHHAEAHSKWEISRHPLPSNLIRTKKREWTEALTDFKAGRRLAPGDADDVGKPQLELSTDIDFSPPSPVEEKQGWKRSWFIRLKIENRGQTPAKNCFGRLLKIMDEKGNQLTRFDSLNLYWRRQDRPENYKPLDIRENGDFDYLDVAQVKEANDVLTLRVVVPGGHRLVIPPGYTQRPEDLPPGIYYAHIGVYADNASIKPTWFEISWDTNYSVNPPCGIEFKTPLIEKNGKNE